MSPRSSLTVRILAAFLLSFLGLSGAMVYALAQLEAVGEDLTVSNAGYLPLSRMATRLESAQERIDLDLERALEVPDPPWERMQASTMRHGRLLEEVVGAAEGTVNGVLPEATHPEDIAVLTALAGQLDTIAEAHADYQALTASYLSLGVGGDRAGAEALHPTLVERRRTLDLEIGQLGKRVEDSVRRVNERTAAAQERAVLVAGGLGLGALLVGGVMLALAAISLRPIPRLTNEVQRIAAGDYAARVDVGGTDELGILAAEVNAMAASIEQRAAELEGARSRLSSVLDAIRLGLVVVSGTRVELANPAAREMWGVVDGGELPGELQQDGEALAVGDRRFDLRQVPFGEGSLLVGEDVTERLEARERLARSERLALVGQLLAQVTHEVRNPLNAMSLNAELLNEELEALPAERRGEALAILGTVTSEIGRLEEVTEQYLDLARLRQASPELEDLPALVRGVARLVEEELRQAGVELRLEVEEVGQVVLDGNQIRRALLNVVRNAAQSGATRVVVGLLDGDHVEISVTDDGGGMEPEVAERAFDPFFSTRSRGTGLGLAITRRILEDHGGQVRVVPRPDGTRVTLMLPR